MENTFNSSLKRIRNFDNLTEDIIQSFISKVLVYSRTYCVL